MIEELSIRNLGVIGEATVPLGPGFTALTGETGAGKTMVVTALGLLRGERADSGVVRSGGSQASVEGRWLFPAAGVVAERVRDAGGDLDEAADGYVELLLARSVSDDGRSRAFVGGRGAPAGLLADLGEHLVVVHGQSHQIRLRSMRAQRQALDRFAGTPVAVALATYAEVYARWQANSVQLAAVVSEKDRRGREAEELRQTVAEIDAVAPQPGEDETLAERAERLGNREELRVSATQAREIISANEGDQLDIVTLFESARRQIENVARHDPALGSIAAAITSASYLAADISAQLSSYLAGLEADAAQELDAVQNRRSELNTLVRKYGPSLTDVIAFAAASQQRLSELHSDPERIEALAAAVGEDANLVEELATQLSELRTEAAQRLATAVSEELTALAMPGAHIVVQVEQSDEPTATGRDTVSILLTPHRGSPPRPLTKGASGGELSRVMLAIEVVIASTDPVPTFIFDEIDSGVGGEAAIEIGRRLHKLATTSQVIVVTHLAQVAAFASNHLGVVKDTDGVVTASSVRKLEGATRQAEMARLLSGLTDSESGLAHARELLDIARTTRPHPEEAEPSVRGVSRAGDARVEVRGG